VPLARRFAAQALAGPSDTTLLTAAKLVVSELVTNAMLYGGRPVVMRLRPRDNGVRVEVQDGSRSVPMLALADSGAMTGRGLALVEALAHRWGVSPVPGGKVVWCDLGSTPRWVAGEPELDADALLRAWDDEEPEAEQRYTVRVGDVPTDLLVQAKAHVDNLVREFTLAAAGASSGQSVAVLPGLSDLVEAVVHRFADARQAIKRQALTAAARGEARTSLTLNLPASAADAGEAYLAALDQADAYARAARLLTLETPPQHKVFRRWYVEAVVAQLRAAASGQPAPARQTFEQRLLDELDAVTAAQRMAERAARLQTATAALARTTTAEEVADVVVAEGVAALEASGGGLVLAGDDDDDRFTVPGAVGYGSRLLERLRAGDRGAELPAAVALRTGQAVWLESRQAIDERFPELAGLEPATASLCAVGVRGTDRVLGALRFSFDSPRLFGDDERRFLLALAGQTAQALERSSLYQAERRARGAAEALATRLARLQRVMAELTAVAGIDDVAEVVVTHAADAVGAIVSSLCLLEGDVVRVVGIRGEHRDARERWQTFPLDADLPASEAIRTNELVVVPNRAELERRYPSLAGYVEGSRALVCLPLHVGERRLGAITLSFSLDRNVTDPGELAFLTSLADACSQAIDRSLALEEAHEATAKLAFLAEASAELASSLDYRTTLTNVARLVVPRLADWCVVYVIEDGEYEPVAVAHVDPAKVAHARELQRRYPIDPAAPTGVPNVVRTGVSELYPEITDEMLVAATVDAEQLRVFRALGLSSLMTVPLTAPAGTLGAIQLVHAESGRRYGPADLALAEEIARRAAIAVHNAWEYRAQMSRVAAITRVAEAAQRAILAPVRPRVGSLALAAAYVSAAEDALVGGDFYETVARPGAVRLLIGDVRGKGLDAVRLATVVLGQFRAAAVDCDELAAVAAQMDDRLRPYLADEDFVTALLAEVRDDGTCQIVSCGHPPALHVRNGTISEVACSTSVPLGLGALPPPATIELHPGDRLLLYTDGLIEVRDDDGQFVDLDPVLAPLATEPLATVLERVLEVLSAAAGGELDDDLALLVAEYRPRRTVMGE